MFCSYRVMVLEENCIMRIKLVYFHPCLPMSIESEIWQRNRQRGFLSDLRKAYDLIFEIVGK